MEVQQPAVVGPGAKLQITLLYIKWEPPDINVAGTLQNAWRDVLGKSIFSMMMMKRSRLKTVMEILLVLI